MVGTHMVKRPIRLICFGRCGEVAAHEKAATWWIVSVDQERQRPKKPGMCHSFSNLFFQQQYFTSNAVLECH
jgi:hypothetical protein